MVNEHAICETTGVCAASGKPIDRRELYTRDMDEIHKDIAHLENHHRDNAAHINDLLTFKNKVYGMGIVLAAIFLSGFLYAFTIDSKVSAALEKLSLSIAYNREKQENSFDKEISKLHKLIDTNENDIDKVTTDLTIVGYKFNTLLVEIGKVNTKVSDLTNAVLDAYKLKENRGTQNGYLNHNPKDPHEY